MTPLVDVTPFANLTSEAIDVTPVASLTSEAMDMTPFANLTSEDVLPLMNVTSSVVVTSQDGHKIVGGYEVRPGQYPFVAGLWPAAGSRPYCGGAVLSKK